MRVRLLTLFFALTLFTGCLKNDVEDVCDYNDCSYTVPASEITAVQQYLTNNGLTATQHCSGLFYEIIAAGTGPTPDVCSSIGVKYKGMLTNGNVFDEQTNTFYFRLGELINAWKNGLVQLKEGGKIRLYVPPSLGYGSTDRKDASGNVVIPANSILVFDIELVAVG